ncbi:MAG: hypothetical protein ACRDRA_02570 [Pseudonocardiaceae bacterium]
MISAGTMGDVDLSGTVAVVTGWITGQHLVVDGGISAHPTW